MQLEKHVCRQLCLFACLAVVITVCGLASAQTEKIELHVWGLNMGIPRAGWFALVEEFERQHPNIDVIIGPADRGSDLQKLLCGIIGDSPPDVFKREANLFGDIAARGILMPIDRFVEADKDRPDGIHEADYSPGMWESLKGEDGKLYAIPEGTNALFLAYNKDVFREEGLDPEKPPRTWKELQEYTKLLTKRDKNGRITRLGTMIHAPYMEDDLIFYISQLGESVLSPDGRECLLDEEPAFKALSFLKDTIELEGGRRAFDDFARMQEGMGTWPLGEGDIAMSVEGHFVISGAMRRNSDMDLGMTPVPVPEGHPFITTSARHGLYLIPYNARHPEEAWEFIRFAARPEGYMIFAEALAAQQAEEFEQQALQMEERADRAEANGNADEAAELRARAEERREKKGQMYPGFQANRVTQQALEAKFTPNDPIFGAAYRKCSRLLEEIDYVPPPKSPIYAVIVDECQRAVDRVLYGEMDVKDALMDADRRIQKQLDLYYGREGFATFSWVPVWVLTGALTVGAIIFFWWRSREERAATALARHDNRMGLIFISPWAIGFVVFIAGPMIFSLVISFCDYDVIHRPRFVGLQNYTFMLGSDPLFWKSFFNTIYMVMAIPLTMSVSLLIAVLLNAKVQGMKYYRTIFYLPAITPAIAAAVLWYALLNPDGLVNDGLRAIGIAQPPSWLGDASWSKPAIILMQIWAAGGGMILWLAGLQGIPSQLYEAASIDGAGRARQFFSITLPMLTPYIFFSFVTGIIGVFQIFAQALVLTRGGPADSTLFYVYYLFNNAFRYFKMGYASAMAWILFIIILIVTLVQWRMSKRWVHYE